MSTYEIRSTQPVVNQEYYPDPAIVALQKDVRVLSFLSVVIFSMALISIVKQVKG